MKPGCLGSVISFDALDKYCEACAYNLCCRDKVQQRLGELRRQVDVSDYIREFNIGQAKHGENIVDVAENEKPVSDEKLKSANKRVVEKEITHAQLAQLRQAWIPKKAKQLMLRLFKKGIDGGVVKNQLFKGINPFKNEPPATLKVACELLLRGGFEKKELRHSLMSHSPRQMSHQTAISQVSLLTSTLIAIEVAYEQNGRFMLVKEK